MSCHTKRFSVTSPVFLCISTGQLCFNIQQQSPVPGYCDRQRVKHLRSDTSQEETLLRKHQTWRRPSTVCQKNQGNTQFLVKKAVSSNRTSHQIPQGRACVHAFVHTHWQGRGLGYLIARWMFSSTCSIKQQLF